MGALGAAFLAGAVSTEIARARPGDQTPYAAIEQLARVLVIVENEYVDPVERDKLLSGAIKGMVGELDPHSAYLPPDENALFQSETEGKFGGVGIEVELKNERIVVVAPIEGSPAERAGIKSGDRIVAINGEPTRGAVLDKLVKKMRGEQGSKVELTIVGAEDDRPRVVTLTREVIKVSSVVGHRMKGDIAYLRVKQFQGTTHEEFLRVVGKLRGASPKPLAGVILDMRNNPGGLVDQATAIADEFLGAGLIYATRRRGKVVEEARATSGGALVELPTVVLVNEFSASASELVAGALQDHQRAKVIGAVTFGKGSVQTILDLGNNVGMKLTTMRYTTPNGRIIQAAGIQPDIVVDQPLPLPPGARITREKDLENTLPPIDGAPPPRPAPSAPPRPAASSGVEPPDPTSRKIPDDPSASPDLVLRKGYEVVRGK